MNTHEYTRDRLNSLSEMKAIQVVGLCIILRLALYNPADTDSSTTAITHMVHKICTMVLLKHPFLKGH